MHRPVGACQPRTDDAGSRLIGGLANMRYRCLWAIIVTQSKHGTEFRLCAREAPRRLPFAQVIEVSRRSAT